MVATSSMAQVCLKAAEALVKEGISAEVFAPRTIVPLDKATIIDSVRKTSLAIIVDESHQSHGVTAEIAARIAEKACYHLDAPVARLGAMDVPVPFSPALEDLTATTPENVAEVARRQLRREMPHDVIMPARGMAQDSRVIVIRSEAVGEAVVTLDAAFLLARAFGAQMVARGKGWIVFVASVLSFLGGWRYRVMRRARGPVVQLTRALANAWASGGATVGAVAPGYIDTDNTATPDSRSGSRRRAAGACPGRTLGKPR
jgi:NAD(P)-dependent dehydrogenase (short-subunit alcohol dehydrogenase family)